MLGVVVVHLMMESLIETIIISVDDYLRKIKFSIPLAKTINRGAWKTNQRTNLLNEID